jgi:uncharacterized protein (TIGR02996 family)
MHYEQTFLQAIQEHPDDASVRLVFADWLEERGDPRAELVRLLHTLTQAIKVKHRARLEERLWSLLASGVNPVAPTRINTIGMELVLVPAGRFMMGSPKKEKRRIKHEHQHEVQITRSFYLGKYTVTRGQFRAFTKATGYKTEAEQENSGDSWTKPGFEQTDKHPVVQVSWNDARQFCKWLSQKEGQCYRLPTEAEWEYSCRAGTTTRFYHGDDLDGLASVGNVLDNSTQKQFPNWNFGIGSENGYVFTAPVGQFRPNGFGLYDMHGNVWEWCQDWSDRYSTEAQQDPQGPRTGGSRVLRGGAWCGEPVDCRSACRGTQIPGERSNYYGFRVARVWEHR